MLPLALLALLLPLALAQSLNKTLAYPAGLGPSFVFGSSLPSRFSALSILPDVPAQCITYATTVNSSDELYCDPGSGGVMQAANITIQDCQGEPEDGFLVGSGSDGRSWTVCRCSDAPNTFPVLQQQFARLPVNLRDYVRYVVAFSGEESAFSESGDMVLFGDESTEQGMTVLIHESHHDIDQGTSASSEWLDAIAQDTCVPDGYAATDAVEDFAQTGVVHLYLDIFGTPPGGVDLSCMSNQLSVFDSNPRLNKAAMDVAPGSFPTCDMGVRGGINVPPARAKRAPNPARPTSTVLPLPERGL